MHDRLISIIMPVKNAGLYLEDCLRSIQSQTDQHWELLAVNDHSDDHSKAYASASCHHVVDRKRLGHANHI